MFEKFPKDLKNAIEKLPEWKQKILQEDITDAISYIKTKDRGYLPLGVTDNFNIDYLYYLNRIPAVVERPLGVSYGFTQKAILEYLRGGRTL